MREEEIRDIIFDILLEIAPEADLKTLPHHGDLRKTLDIDSFDFLNLMIGLNERLGVDIPESDYEKLNTLSNMLTYLSARLG
ncbi:Acyl carrier protein [uncultured Desulfobacterium sp.]|uniref:Acyl carrier protein n=1 Tax=uncultured Desulfobacterium sp. TaxID=201089 RepID=A0A445MSX8_9BACT|nr:Acyl carrier protein [uncultured Desulfobacterium sp.]